VVIERIPVNGMFKQGWRSLWCRRGIDGITSSYWRVAEGGRAGTVRRERTRGSARTMTGRGLCSSDLVSSSSDTRRGTTMGDSSFLTVKDTRVCQQENTCNDVEGVLLAIKGRD
jgi:hypothetical protein